MDLTLQLLENRPQRVNGLSWRAELLTRVRVADGAAVRLAHGGPRVGEIVGTWWSGDLLMARARIDDRHASDVREAVSDTRGASLEFSDEGDSELVSDVMSDGGSCMRIRGAKVVGVAVGQHRPSRGDTMVVGDLPPAPSPEPVLAARAAHPSYGERSTTPSGCYVLGVW